jgi:hypothetical protein
VDGLIKWAVLIIAMLVGLGVKTFWPSYPDDNCIEEAIEQLIQYETDVDIDMTPLSEEDNNIC